MNQVLNRAKLLIVLALIILLTACGANTNEDPSTDNPNNNNNQTDMTHDEEQKDITLDNDHFEVYGVKLGDTSEQLVDKLGVPATKESEDGIHTYFYTNLPL